MDCKPSQKVDLSILLKGGPVDLSSINLSTEECSGSRLLWPGPWIAPEALPWVAGGHSASPPGSLRRQHAGIASRASRPPAADLKKFLQVFPTCTSSGNTTGTSSGNTTGTSSGNTIGKYYRVLRRELLWEILRVLRKNYYRLFGTVYGPY